MSLRLTAIAFQPRLSHVVVSNLKWTPSTIVSVAATMGPAGPSQTAASSPMP